MILNTISIDQPMWRVCSKRHASSAFSGIGAAITGGRYNKIGTETLYIAFDLKTALKEFEHHRINKDQQKTILHAHISAKKIVDFTNEDTLEALKIDTAFLTRSYAEDNYLQSQALAETLINQGFKGIKYKSVLCSGINLALWAWNKSIKPSFISDRPKANLLINDNDNSLYKY